jgi:hypothetical protein
VNEINGEKENKNILRIIKWSQRFREMIDMIYSRMK